MASAMGSWWAPLAPAMYWVILDTTSRLSWAAKSERERNQKASFQNFYQGSFFSNCSIPVPFSCLERPREFHSV